MRRWRVGERDGAFPWAVLRLVLVLAVFAMTGCTTGQVYPRPPRITQAPTPSPTLTAVEDAVRASIPALLPRRCLTLAICGQVP